MSECGCGTLDGSEEATGPTCYCSVEHVIDVMSKKHALSIFSLVASRGPMRHSEIADSLDVRSSSVLADRLHELTEIGLLDRTSYDEVPPHVEYSLTPDGREFERNLRPLLEWSQNEAHPE